MKIIVASGPVIIENHKVLLNRHGQTEEEARLWKFVGGKIEFSDEEDLLENSCKREAMEEMGIKIEIIRPLKPMMIKKPGSKDDFVVLIHYLARRLTQIKPGKDIVEWGWFDLNKLPDNCAPNIQVVLQSIKKERP